MASDNEPYFDAVNRDAVGSCADARAFSELEYQLWLDSLKGARSDDQQS